MGLIITIIFLFIFLAAGAVMSDQTYRRVFGLLFGAVIGFLFGVVSSYINRVFLPGYPFYQPPLGPFLNMVLCALVGALLGWINALPRGGVIGALISASVGAVLALIVSFVIGSSVVAVGQAGNVFAAQGIVAVFLFFPFAGALLIPMGLFRWAIEKQLSFRGQLNFFHPSRIWLPLLFAIAAIGLGATSLIPAGGRTVVRRMDVLLQSGINAGSADLLPKPLLHKDVGDFLGYATPKYQLQWTRQDLQKYGIGYPYGTESTLSLMIARFDNGWGLVCLYPTPEEDPRCKGFMSLPR